MEEFKQKRIEGRRKLLEKIIAAFKNLNPVAIHQFGSGTTGFKDEFSDIDIWVTFKDEDISHFLKQSSQIFKGIAPVLIKHHSRSWSPVGGGSYSVIHETEFGLFVVDYYVSKASETVIKEDSAILFGEDSLKRGKWKLNKDLNKNIHDSHTIRKDIDLLIDLIFISYKGIIRKWNDESFVNSLKLVHKNFRQKYYKKLKLRRIGLNYKSNYRILRDLYKISNKRQRRAINKIRKYARQIEILY